MIINKIFRSPTLTTWGNFLVKFGGWLFLLPLILSHFDSEIVSVWLIFQTINGILNLFDLGFTQSFSRAFSYCIGGAKTLRVDEKGRFITDNDESGEVNWHLFSQVFHTSKRLYILIAALGLVGTSIICYFSLDVPAQNFEEAEYLWITVAVVSIGGAIRLYGNLYLSTLMGANKVPLVNNWESVFGVMNLLTSFTLFFTIPNIFILIANQQLWYILSVIRNHFLIKKKFNKIINAGYDKNILKIVFSSAWKSSLGIIFGYGTIQITSIMLARYEEPGVVASYLLALKFITLISDFSRAPFYSKLPEITIKYAQNDYQSLLTTTRRGLFISLLVFCLIFIWVLYFGNLILELMNSQTEFVSILIWSILGVGYFLERYGAIHIQLYSITNHILWHKITPISGTIYLVVILFLYPSVGIISFPIAILLSNLYYSVYNSYLVYIKMRLPWLVLNLKTSLPLLILILLVVFYENLLL